MWLTCKVVFFFSPQLFEKRPVANFLLCVCRSRFTSIPKCLKAFGTESSGCACWPWELDTRLRLPGWVLVVVTQGFSTSKHILGLVGIDTWFEISSRVLVTQPLPYSDCYFVFYLLKTLRVELG